MVFKIAIQNLLTWVKIFKTMYRAQNTLDQHNSGAHINVLIELINMYIQSIQMQLWIILL